MADVRWTNYSIQPGAASAGVVGWTNFTSVGNGSGICRTRRIADESQFTLYFTGGSTTNYGSGTAWIFFLPDGFVENQSGIRTILGNSNVTYANIVPAVAVQASGPNYFPGIGRLQCLGPSLSAITVMFAAGLGSSSVPFSWGANDYLIVGNALPAPQI